MEALQQLENRFTLTTGQAAALLGLDRRRYWEFRTGQRKLPRYIVASARAHLAANKKDVAKWTAETL
jgi:hypothetical protein